MASVEVGILEPGREQGDRTSAGAGARAATGRAARRRTRRRSRRRRRATSPRRSRPAAARPPSRSSRRRCAGPGRPRRRSRSGCPGAAVRPRRTAAASRAAPRPPSATLARQIAPLGETGPPWKSSCGRDTALTQSGSTASSRVWEISFKITPSAPSSSLSRTSTTVRLKTPSASRTLATSRSPGSGSRSAIGGHPFRRQQRLGCRPTWRRVRPIPVSSPPTAMPLQSASTSSGSPTRSGVRGVLHQLADHRVRRGDPDHDEPARGLAAAGRRPGGAACPPTGSGAPAGRRPRRAAPCPRRGTSSAPAGGSGAYRPTQLQPRPPARRPPPPPARPPLPGPQVPPVEP